MVGYFAYDCVYSLFEKVRERHDGSTPPVGDHTREDHDANFMLTKDCIVFDHVKKKLFVFSSPFLTYESDLEDEYEQCVTKIRSLGDHITSLVSGKKVKGTPKPATGSTPEYVPSVSQEAFERSVARVNEHIIAGDIFQAVISRRMEKRRVTTVSIAGTRPRGCTRRCRGASQRSQGAG